MLKVTLHELDGTLVAELLATDVQIEVDGTRAVRRTASFTVPVTDLAELRVLGRQIRIEERATSRRLFTGFFDDVVATAGESEATVRVSCRDKSKRLRETTFAEDTTFNDVGATDTGQLATAASASSFLAAGQEIQGWADVYEQRVTVYDLGVARRVNDARVSGDIRLGNLAVEASGGSVQKVALDVYLDLRAVEQLQVISLTHTGWAGQIEISSDAISWAAYAGGAVTCRYVHVQVTGGLTITAGIMILAGANYPASNVLADDENAWRPGVMDLERSITLDAGTSVTANVLYTRWGLNDAERQFLVQFDLFRSPDGLKWYRLGTWLANAGVHEAVFPDAAARYWKIRVLATWYERPALRFAELKRVVSTDTVDEIIRSVASGEGETQLQLTATRRRASVTFEAGKKKWDALQEIVNQVLGNWELFYAADGVLVLQPRLLRTDAPKHPAVLLPPFSFTISDADLANEIVAVHEAQGSTLRHVARNENPGSIASIPRIGRRTIVVKSDVANTTDKLRVFALRTLAERTRITIPAEITMPADPCLEPGDVLQISEAKTGTDGLFVLHAYSLGANLEQAQYDLKARLEAL